MTDRFIDFIPLFGLQEISVRGGVAKPLSKYMKKRLESVQENQWSQPEPPFLLNWDQA